MSMCHIVICDLPRSTSPFHIILQKAWFKKKFLDIKFMVWFFLQLCLEHLSLQEELSEVWLKTCIGFYVQYRLFLSDVKHEYSGQCFEKYWNIEFHENPSTGSRVVPSGQTDVRMVRQTDGRTDRRTDWRTDGPTDWRRDIMMMITVAFAILLGRLTRDQISYPRRDSKAHSQ